jgi:hypothetical protein
MHPIHSIIALDLARERSREHASAAERWRLASQAASGSAAAGASPPGRHAPRSARGAAVLVLRAVASVSAHIAGSAGRAASRVERRPA